MTSSPATLAVLPTNSTIIAQWNFNSPVSDANTTTGTLTPSVGSGLASYVGGTVANGSGFASGSSSDPNAADNSAWNTTNYPVLLQAPEQFVQRFRDDAPTAISSYWMWRFDRLDEPVPLDNFWNKTIEQCVADLRAANNPQAGQPNGAAEVELLVDAYFPNTIAALPSEQKGKAVHPGGFNRLWLDCHAQFIRDKRLQ